jgi:shikimate kinase
LKADDPAPASCRVVLMGMMGSGKSTIGEELARLTGWPYHDNDEVLQLERGRTAREVLAAEGRGELRLAEAAALRIGLDQPAPCLIGAAAGTILEKESRDLLNAAAIVVWLTAAPETLAARAAGAEHRPWLEGDAVAWMREALAERAPLYESVADLSVDTDGQAPAEPADTILGWLRRETACGEWLRSHALVGEQPD